MKHLMIFLLLMFASYVAHTMQNRIDQSKVDDQLKQVLVVDGQLKQ